jgi:energy-coupling factor transporter ATP-binding protein EcfA2
MLAVYLQIKTLKALRDVIAEGEKIVLYGPNGAGKSTVIHLLLLALTKLSARQYYDSDVLPGDVLNKGEAIIKFKDFEIHINGYQLIAKKGGYTWKSVVTSSDDVWNQELVVWHVDEMAVRQIGHVKGCGILFGGGEVRLRGDSELFVIRCPEVARRLYVEVYYDKAHDPELGWIPLAHLSYGQRRRLAIEAALETGDFVAVENFEAGLHIDYIADLMDKIAEFKAEVVVETHSGLVVKGALRHGFSVYKVEEGRVRRIMDVTDDKLFRREYEYYQLLV